MSNQPYRFEENNKRLWAVHGDRPMGAVNQNQARTYTFPFYTPSGINLLQEAPPDHVHQQGIMVGQDHLNGHNFWAMLHKDHPLNRQVVRAEERREEESGLTLLQQNRWITTGEQSIMSELRETRFEKWEEGNFVEVHSTWTATFGDLYIGNTKEGGLGMRLEAGLESRWGGTIRSSTGAKGGKEVYDQTADWVEVFGKLGGRDVGIVMMPHPSQPQIPWFSRDYGLHLYSPCRHRDLRLPAGETFSLRVGFFAYDGVSDGQQAARAWQYYNERV